MDDDNLVRLMALEKSDLTDLVPRLSEDQRIALTRALEGAEEISDVAQAGRLADNVLSIMKDPGAQADIAAPVFDRLTHEPPSRQKEFSRNERIIFATAIRTIREALERLAKDSDKKGNT